MVWKVLGSLREQVLKCADLLRQSLVAFINQGEADLLVQSDNLISDFDALTKADTVLKSDRLVPISQSRDSVYGRFHALILVSQHRVVEDDPLYPLPLLCKENYCRAGVR